MGNLTFKTYLEELKKHTPYNFCEYSDNSIQRRIDKVLKDHKMTLEDLLHLTRTDEAFVENLVDEITVNTTELFRNMETWEHLYTKVFPNLKSKKNINIWHAGCSTGQEVYSNLILFNELGLLDKVKVVATDINQKVISNAKKAEYLYSAHQSSIQDYNEFIKKYNSNAHTFEHYCDMEKNTDKFVFKDFLKKKVGYMRHDLVSQDIPFYQKFDVIFCRNVLIYFNPELQMRIVRKFFDKLYDGGVLILGNHEALHGFFKTRFIRSGMVYTKSSTFQFKYK
ncbi:CheR family methyltransferase [Plebeiibacterium marinum]|uniref:Protein-glutamate O-methyltransferase CheR n=1 Tax=Plebeiibacterium marinum TaxID=2992111 RepID=A0AAE3SK39_9BACT|nr:protein-glutamate O-methyltransferase CheR [Plebeiobacterium marinum]MCW3806420.1 protein-glutamate O-methyltransferase CheR [Plebeiobacterium marinum]